MKTETPAILAALVDRLATIKAQAATLAAEEQSIRATLADSGLNAIDGTMHRAAITRNPGRVSIDWRAVAEHFSPSRQLITAHTSTGDPFVTIRVSARKGV